MKGRKAMDASTAHTGDPHLLRMILMGCKNGGQLPAG